MNTESTQPSQPIVRDRHCKSLSALALIVIAMLLQGCTSQSSAPQGFSSPGDAVQAFVDAMRANDATKLNAILGGDGKRLVASGDDVADHAGRQKFLLMYDEKHAIADNGGDTSTLVIGKSDWPFPLPIVRDNDKWMFDPQAGEEEILNRRIGANELWAIQTCKAYGDAQREYALLDPNGDGLHEYAQQFQSDPGKRNGLYWPTAAGEKPSPLGQLITQATLEGYVPGAKPVPYHGYCYRILRAQGPSAPNGSLEYVANGKMILGFAIVASPAEYGNSGIMTFIMGDEGVVHQKDLGDQTAKLAAAMDAFDPGEGWKKVE